VARIGVVLLALSAGCGGDEPPPDPVDAVRAAATGYVDALHRAEAWALADRALVLLDGRPAAHGPVRDVLEAPPTPAVAAFVGFSGTLHHPDGTVQMLKPGHAALDPSGDMAATVTRRVPVEDGVRLELTLPNGRVHAFASLPGPQPGDTVRVTLAAGVTHAAADPRLGGSISDATETQ
jgi:hypothetical protein